MRLMMKAGSCPVLLCLLACVAGGCQQEKPTSYTLSDLREPQTLQEAGGFYWNLKNVPDLAIHDNARIAVVDFTVEFVASTLEVPARIFKPDEKPDAEEKPEALAARLNSVEERQIRYEDGFCRRMTDELYVMLTNEMTKRTRQIIPLSEIRATHAYQQVKTIDNFEVVQLGTGRRKDPNASYATWVNVYPVTGLGIAKGTGKMTGKQVAIAVIKELGADVAARVRLRVGVYQGRATIERGSQVWVLSRDVYGQMQLAKTLASGAKVLAPQQFDVAYDDRYVVDSDKYLAAMRQLFPTVIALGFESTRPAPTGK